jgi:hypothetical protein
MNREAVIAKVKAYALAHYNDGGWDVFVECYGDREYNEFIDSTLKYEPDITETALFDAFAQTASIWADRGADAINSAF